MKEYNWKTKAKFPRYSKAQNLFKQYNMKCMAHLFADPKKHSLQELHKFYRTEKSTRVQQRVLCIIWSLEKAYRVPKLAYLIKYHPASVRKWIKAYNQAGIAGLQLQSAGGRPRALSLQEERWICGLLLQSPEKYGFFGQVWDCKTLTLVFTQTYKREVHPDTIWRVLKRNQYRFKLPQVQHPQSNPAAKKKRSKNLSNWQLP